MILDRVSYSAYKSNMVVIIYCFVGCQNNIRMDSLYCGRGRIMEQP